jgi:hypothetical protein
MSSVTWGVRESRLVRRYHRDRKAAHHDEMAILLAEMHHSHGGGPWPTMRVEAALKLAGELGTTWETMDPTLAAMALFFPGVDPSRLVVPRPVRAELVRMLADNARANARRGTAEKARLA